IQVTSSGGTPPYSITWFPTNGQLNGNTIEALAAGEYLVCVSDSFNCVTCFTDTVLEDPLFSNEINSEGFKIYPNPLNQTATLFLKHVPEQCMFAVFELTGRKVFEIIPEKSETTIDLKNLCTGIYYFEISTKGTVQQKGKLILY
ncbi:MAG: T9SS type A sorting domain-containing protein, partial [Bacteroidota bacterium]